MDDRREKDRLTWALASVIIPCFNGAKVIVECLESVFRLDYCPLEVVVVDDCSGDDSAGIISRDFPRARLLKNRENKGFARTVNTGIRAARGEIIVLLNMDTVVEKDWLREMVLALSGDRSVGIVGSKIFSPGKKVLQHAGGLVFENGLTVHIGRNEEDRGQYEEKREVDYVCGAALGFRRDLLEKIGGFREIYRPMYYEDTDLALRARRAGYKVVYAPRSVLVHRENVSTGGLTPSFYFFYHLNRIRYILRNFGLFYLLRKFLPAERKWRRSPLPAEIWGPLKKAYWKNAVGWPRILILRWADGFIPARPGLSA